MKLALLYNEPGPEAGPDDLDTINQVREIRETLNKLGHKTEELSVPCDLEILRKLLRAKRDHLFFNLTDARMGEGRFISLPVLSLEQEGCRYTGSSADALYLTSNKILAKRIMFLAGIPTAPWHEVKKAPDTAVPGNDFITGHYIIKPVWEHGSAGMSPDSVIYASSPEDLKNCLIEAAQDMFAEAFLPGREINISLIADRENSWKFLSPTEIIYTDPDMKNPFLDYRSKWEKTSSAYRMSRRSLDFSKEDIPLLNELRSIALRCTGLFRLNGYARIDFRMDTEGRPMVMEVNANPCLTPDAGFAAAAGKCGIGYAELISRIIAFPADRP